MVILVIDDSRAMRRIQKEVLSRLGDLEILEAEDGVSAIHRMKERDFQVDLILVDWMMPRMNGITFVRLIKSHPTLHRIPILMVTSCCDEHMMSEAWRTGVDGYLLKPFTKELFLQAILALEPEGKDALPAPPESDRAADGKVFLDGLPQDMRRRMLDMSIVVEFAAGEVVLEKGDSVRYFYYVLEGAVEERQAVSGGGALARKYSAGECFAVTELMAGDRLQSRFVVTSAAKIGRLPQAAFEGMLLRYPEIGITLSRLLASKARQMEVQESAEGSNLSGALEILDLPALIQAISLRQKTCLIQLPELDAELCFVCGQIVAVRHADAEGKEAFFRILDAQPKNFKLVVKSVARKRNIHESTTKLLLECARRMDEQVA